MKWQLGAEEELDNDNGDAISTCNCFSEVIFLSALIMASTLATSASMTGSLPASSGGTGTTPAIPSDRSCSTWQILFPPFRKTKPARSVVELAMEGTYLGTQHGDVVVGLVGAVGGVEVLADVVAGVGEEHVGNERDGARRALDVQHHASLRGGIELALSSDCCYQTESVNHHPYDWRGG